MVSSKTAVHNFAVTSLVGLIAGDELISMSQGLISSDIIKSAP